MMIKALKWPFVGILITGAFHFVEEAVLPEMQNFYTAPVQGLVQFGFGISSGYLAVRNGGSFWTAALCGALLGAFPLVVNPLSFGILLGRGLGPSALVGLFGFSMVLFGSLVGGGFAVSLNESKK